MWLAVSNGAFSWLRSLRQKCLRTGVIEGHTGRAPNSAKALTPKPQTKTCLNCQDHAFWIDHGGAIDFEPVSPIPPAAAPSGLAGLQWAQQAGMMGGIDQGTMAMMMMMASAGGPEASNAFLAAAAKHAQSQSNAAAETTPPAAKPTADGARNENEGGTTNG